jgi:hypothetical protein
MVERCRISSSSACMFHTCVRVCITSGYKFGPDARGGNQGTYALDRIRGRLLGGESMPSSVTPGFSVVDMATHDAIDHRGEQKIKCRVVCRKYQEPRIFAFGWSID